MAVTFAVALVGLGDLRTSLEWGLTLMLIWGVAVVVLPAPSVSPTRVFYVAVLIRFIVLFSPVALSDDIFRYLWEGRAVLMGGNPYVDPPGSGIWPEDILRVQVNHSQILTVYPPVALWIFAMLAQIAYSPVVVKVAMGLADAVVAWGIADILKGRGRSTSGAWIYALHPLAVVESAGSGHLEPVAILCVVLAIRAWDRGDSGLWWAGLGALVKLFPVVLIATVWRRGWNQLWLLLLVTVLTTVPFLGEWTELSTGLMHYARHWSFNGSVYAVLSVVFGSLTRPLLIAVGVGVCLWAWRRRSDPAEVALWAGGAFVLLSPTVHPWYVLWAWVPALICGVRAWSVLATLVLLSYAVLASYDPLTSTWEEPLWPPFVEYLVFLPALLLEWLWRRTPPEPSASGRSVNPSLLPSQITPDLSIQDRH